jgi:protein-tyrosine phosphatase
MRILFVDAGNFCRSPVAEVVARSLGERHGLRDRVTFASAGLKDKHAGQPADPRSVEACAARGYDLRSHRCREITAEEFSECDRILAMDRENLAQLEQRKPRGARARVELFLGDAEVPDPYFGEADGFAVMMDQIEAGVRRMLERLEHDLRLHERD